MSEAITSDAVQQRSDVLERVSDGVVSLDHDLRYTYVNTPAAEFLDADADSLLGEHIWDVSPEAKGTKTQDAIERAIESGEKTSFEWYNERLEQWRNVGVHPDETGITIVFSDITAQQERLYELERTDTLFQNAQDGLFVIDVEDGGETFRINQVNPAYEAYTDMSADELQGQTVRDITDEADTALVREKYSTCVSERTSLDYEEYLSTFDGGSWWETRIAPVLVDNEVRQIVGSTQNVTDQKEREQELRRKTRALDNAPVGITITDPSQEDNPMTYVNDRFTEATGYDRDESVGHNCRFLQGEDTDPEQVAKIRTAVDNVESTETTLRNYRKDGTAFWNQLSIAPVRDDDGELESFAGFQKDITTQKEREQRLQTHELVVQTMNDGAFLVSEDNRLRFANDAALHFAGVSLETVKGQPVGPMLEEITAPAEDVNRLSDAIDAVLTGSEPESAEWMQEADGTETLSLEFTFSHASKRVVHAELRLVPVKLDDDERGVVVSARDVTKRREVEQELETHLMQAQKVGQVGSWFLNIDTGDLEWSDECYRIFGLEPGTPMTYERFLETVHPDDREELEEAWDAALESGGYNIEHRIVADGETRWVQETAEIEFSCDGTPESGIGVVRDITEQVQQTHEIRAQKQRYESLFNSIGGAIAVTDLDGQITTCNSGFIDLFGYDTDEVKGNCLRTIAHDSADIDRLLDSTDDPGDSQLINYQKKSGQVFPGESRSSPLRTHDDSISGHVIHIINVSDEQETRKQLQVLGRIFRHNVKNDMNVIMAQAQLIQECGSEAVKSRAEKVLAKSRNFVEMAENQDRITELLTEEPETADFELGPIIQEAVSELRDQYPDATLTTELAPECQASTTREITEAIQELAQNAIIHSDQEHPNVEIHLRDADEMTELTIRDDGPGIPEQEWKVLTTEGDIHPLNHGTGLGLWLVTQAVRRSNGTISFEQNDMGGTTATVRLPTD